MSTTPDGGCDPLATPEQQRDHYRSRAEAAEFRFAQEREFSIDTNAALSCAVDLLREWDKRETALAVSICGIEPFVEPGSFVDRLRRCIADPVEYARSVRRGPPLLEDTDQ